MFMVWRRYTTTNGLLDRILQMRQFTRRPRRRATVNGVVSDFHIRLVRPDNQQAGQLRLLADCHGLVLHAMGTDLQTRRYND